MIIVTTKKSKRGTRLVVKNQNGKNFNDFYTRRTSCQRAWDSFVKQIKSGKVKKVGFPVKRKKR